MSALHAGVDKYLALRRSLGFALQYYEQPLHTFVSFVERRGGVITVDLAVRWATHQSDTSQSWHVCQLDMIRGFARYWSAYDSRTEIPPPRLLPRKLRRRRPFLFTDEDIRRLIEATGAGALHSRSALWPSTVATIIGLLAVTGMRLGEILALNVDDIDWKDGVLIVRRAKFGKSRLVPLHSSTMTALARYVRQRSRVTSASKLLPLFLSPMHMRLRHSQVYTAFRTLLRVAGLVRTVDDHGPNLHDFRHRFAINTLLRAYRAGLDTDRRMFLLSTYLGHACVENTYWYLSATPELMGLARKRLERTLGRLP